MSSIRIDWGPISEEEWQVLIGHCQRSNLFQSWSYGEAIRATEGFKADRGVVRRAGESIGLVQVFRKSRLNIAHVVKLMRGPLFFDPAPPPADIAETVQVIKRRFSVWSRSLLQIMPEVEAGPVADAVLEKCALVQTRTGYETAWLDLRPEPATLRNGLRQNWRHQLVAAETLGMEVTVESASEAFEWLMERYERDKREKSYTGPADALLRRIPTDERLVFRATAAEGPIAGILILLHGRCATYQVGWNSEPGRAANAHNLLLWRAVERLRESGFLALDLGGLDEVAAPGVAHFKRGLGAQPVTLMGTYV